VRYQSLGCRKFVSDPQIKLTPEVVASSSPKETLHIRECSPRVCVQDPMTLLLKITCAGLLAICFCREDSGMEFGTSMILDKMILAPAKYVLYLVWV
jgi:hypothetical protein